MITLLQAALLLVFPVLVIVGALRDLTSFTIPNWISGLLILAFFPAALLVGIAPMAIGAHLLIGLGALAAGIGMFALRWVGGGDAKLMAATCLWLGLSGSGLFLLWTGMAGGVFCLTLIAARRNFQAYAVGGWVGHLLEPKGDIPYGVAICAGALAAFPGSPLALSLATLG